MHVLEVGILEPSQVYFLMPSEFAEKVLYCLQHIGVFYCDGRYVVTHRYWESMLMIFIDEGALEVVYQDEMFLAQPGDVVLIDCRNAHSYHALERVKFHYFHFTGVSSVEYVQHLYALHGSALIQSGQSDVLDSAFGNLMRLAQAQLGMQNEHRISVYLHMILSELADACSVVAPVTNEWVNKAISYMEEHITESISIDEVAAHVNLSKFYFTRYFRKHLGLTPHQYFLNMRIQYAKRILVTTYDSVERVAEGCGFDNASNFIRVFKQRTGMTPTAFRKISF